MTKTIALRFFSIASLVWALSSLALGSRMCRADEDQVYSEREIQVWSEYAVKISDGQPNDLMALESTIEQVEASNRIRLDLLRVLASRYRDLNEPESARRVASLVLTDPIFERRILSPEDAGRWSDAAFTFVYATQPDDRPQFIEQVQDQLASSKQSVCFRMKMLDFLIVLQSKQLQSDAARTLAMRYLPELLRELPDEPSPLMIYQLWQIDSTLSDARVPTPLRLELLEWCSRSTDAAIRAKSDFDLRFYNNLMNIRGSVARLHLEAGADQATVLASLDGTDELLELVIERIRSSASDDGKAAVAIDKTRAEYGRRVQLIQELATNHHRKGQEESALLGQPSPAVDLRPLAFGLGSDNLTLDDKVVVLEFWAIWCGPCIAVLHDLNKLHEKYQDRDFEIVGITSRYGYKINPATRAVERAKESDMVSREDEANAILEFLRPHSVTFGQVLDDGTLAEAFGVKSWPTTVLIDRNGVVRFVGSISSMPRYEQLQAKIEELFRLD